MVTTRRESVEVGIEDLAERNSMTCCDLRAFLLRHTGTPTFVHVQIRYYNI